MQVVLVVILLIVLSAGGAVRAQAPYTFEGFSSTPVTGEAGYAGMNGACRDDFGENARMCTTREFIESPGAAPPPANTQGQLAAFVNPLIVAGGVDSSGQRPTNCAAWTTRLGRGMVVVEGGGLSSDGNCAIASAVTCCTPAR